MYEFEKYEKYTGQYGLFFLIYKIDQIVKEYLFMGIKIYIYIYLKLLN